MKRSLPLVVIGTVLIAATAGGVILFRSKRGGNLFTSGTTASKGSTSPGVSITLEEFGDYQCPPCGRLHPELKRLIGEYGPRLNFVFRNLPLTKNHKNALMAAQAAEAARLQGHFMEMHDILYELQDEWKDENDPQPIFLKYAAAAGLDLNRFSRDYDGPEVKQRIESDVRRAESMGIDSTPTILMEGNQLRAEVTNPEGIRKGIELVLARKAAQAR